MTAPVTVVTSLNAELWDRYARRNIEAMSKRLPKSVQIIVYYDDVPQTSDKRILWLPISSVAHWPEFDKAVSHFPLFRGIHNSERGMVYNIHTDSRMARKAFIEAHACERYKGNKIFWIDADVFVHADVPERFFHEVLPDDKFCCYLGRDHVPYFTESGVIGFNSAHELCRVFMDAYVGIFRSGVFVTLQAGWHDCAAFDVIRKAVQPQRPDAFNDLGAGVNVGPGLNVMINSQLGKYFDHLKGNRKVLDRSPLADLTVKRDEPHWAA
jgi:hypothetical protein